MQIQEMTPEQFEREWNPIAFNSKKHPVKLGNGMLTPPIDVGESIMFNGRATSQFALSSMGWVTGTYPQSYGIAIGVTSKTGNRDLAGMWQGHLPDG